MTMQNHWGVWVDSEVPVPGVVSANLINWEYLDNEICLDCEQIYAEIDREHEENGGSGEEENFRDYDEVECFDHTKLFGDWIKDEEGKYIPDKENGEFAAVYTQGSFNDFTVIWSKFIKKNVALCSPCAPGCGSIDSNGSFSCYELPPYLYYNRDEE